MAAILDYGYFRWIYHFLDIFIGGGAALATWRRFQRCALRDLIGNARSVWNLRRPKTYRADGLESGQAASIHHKTLDRISLSLLLFQSLSRAIFTRLKWLPKEQQRDRHRSRAPHQNPLRP